MPSQGPTFRTLDHDAPSRSRPGLFVLFGARRERMREPAGSFGSVRRIGDLRGSPAGAGAADPGPSRDGRGVRRGRAGVGAGRGGARRGSRSPRGRSPRGGPRSVPSGRRCAAPSLGGIALRGHLAGAGRRRPESGGRPAPPRASWRDRPGRAGPRRDAGPDPDARHGAPDRAGRWARTPARRAGRTARRARVSPRRRRRAPRRVRRPRRRARRLPGRRAPAGALGVLGRRDRVAP